MNQAQYEEVQLKLVRELLDMVPKEQEREAYHVIYKLIRNVWEERKLPRAANLAAKELPK